MVSVRRHEGHRYPYLAGGGLVLIALLFGAAAPPSAKAPLNQPTPCARQQCGPEQPKSGGNDQPAAIDKRGTEAAPFLVKVINAPDGPIQTQSAQPKAFEKPAPDWRAPEWSIVWATLLLVAVGLGQLYMFLKQLRYMRDAMTDAKAAAEAATISANAAKQSADLAVSVERAWIAVDISSIQQVMGGWQIGSGIYRRFVDISAVNKGRTPCEITTFKGIFRALDHVPTEADEVFDRPGFENQTFDVTMIVGANGDAKVSPQACWEIGDVTFVRNGDPKPGIDFYVWGTVAYRALIAVNGVTTFKRKWDANVGWVNVGPPQDNAMK